MSYVQKAKQTTDINKNLGLVLEGRTSTNDLHILFEEHCPKLKLGADVIVCETSATALGDFSVLLKVSEI